MERRTFEDSLKDAFKDAEATPSDKVWTNVELELEKEAGTTVRRRLVFYQLLAAAAVTLTLLSTGVAYFMINNRDQTIGRLVAESQVSKNGINDQAIAQRPEASAGQVTPEGAQVPGVTDNSNGAGIDDDVVRAGNNESPAVQQSGTAGSPNGIASAADPVTVEDQHNTIIAELTTASTLDVVNESNEQVAAHERALPIFFTPSIQKPSRQQVVVDPVAAMMSKLAEEEMKLAANDKQKKQLNEEKLWTALGVAAGGFNGGSHTSAPTQSMGLAAFTNTSVPDKQSRASGVAYSMGLSFGTKVARRWVVQGGVNYLTQSSNYVATNVIAGPNYTTLQAESINALGKLPLLADAATADRLAPTVPYSVNNNLKYFSLPMQAGYLLVNQKFGVQLNAGISTDLFLENTITPEGGSLDKTTQSSGSESPYRTVNFSGLMGTEFSYRLGQRYRIALNPALRYPLNSVYKSDVGIESMPLTFDVGLRFRYIFK